MLEKSISFKPFGNKGKKRFGVELNASLAFTTSGAEEERAADLGGEAEKAKETKQPFAPFVRSAPKAEKAEKVQGNRAAEIRKKIVSFLAAAAFGLCAALALMILLGKLFAKSKE